MTIQFPVQVMDENCINCQAIELEKMTLYGGADTRIVQYSCSNLHLCQYIRNRIVRKEQKEEEKIE